MKEKSKLEIFVDKVILNNREFETQRQKEAKLEALYRLMAQTSDISRKHTYLDAIIREDKGYHKRYGMHFIPLSYRNKVIKVQT